MLRLRELGVVFPLLSAGSGLGEVAGRARWRLTCMPLAGPVLTGGVV